MEKWEERPESGGRSLSEPQNSPVSIPGSQTLALSQAGPTESVLPRLPEGLAALTIPIRLDALSYLLHSALLGAYSLRPGAALCPCHPNPCCARPPALDEPVAQDPPRQHWARSRSPREALRPREVGPKGGRGLEPPVGTTKQSLWVRPSPIRHPIKDQGSEYQRRRPPASLPRPKEERESKHYHQRSETGNTREYQHHRPPSPPPQPKETYEGRYHHKSVPPITSSPPAEDWESEYQEAPGPTMPGPQDASSVCSENVDNSSDAQAPQP
ncbi:uncharacterized protein C19orf84 homolog [Dromiciops gliroides]|uniref:uncharacterized protein C19orf84 homolog n=1 Tax=Dromiciops gliroides TaxID=33562 RepID=UPI001CC60766|nr:uncharacterized protein C19orf84 homolog [Dromiciops gliroides]